MELYISIIAAVISLVSVFVSIAIYLYGISRERKQATLNAFNGLQEQVFDKLNQYTFEEIREICENWEQIPPKRKWYECSQEQIDKMNHTIAEYRVLSGYLARIEHFSLGVNTGIYDARIAERAATTYFVMLYRNKLKPLLDKKQAGAETEYYAEFRKLVEKIEKIEAKPVKRQTTAS